MHPAAIRPRRMSKSEATCRRGVCPSRVVRRLCEAHASPADRGFGLMARGPGRIPCRIARPVGPGIRRRDLARTRNSAAHALAASDPRQHRHGATPRASGSSGEPDHAARAFGLGRPDSRPTQPPPHQPLVMISLRCSGRGGESHGLEGGGIRKLEHPHDPQTRCHPSGSWDPCLSWCQRRVGSLLSQG